MPSDRAGAPVAEPAPGTPRPAWLPEGVEVPVPPSQPGIPLIQQPVVIGAAYNPISAPVWESQTLSAPSRRSTTRTVLLWIGLAVGGLILLFGLLAIPVSLAGSGTQRSDSLSSAALFIIVGGAFFVPCLASLLGFGPVVSASFRELGILGYIVVLATVINTAVVVTRPVGGGRFVIPWAGVVLVMFRAWRGRWLGAGIIVGVWAVCSVIILTMARP